MLNDYYMAAAKRLIYCPLDGSFSWSPSSDVRPHLRGKPAGSKFADGYVYITHDGKRLLAHRIAWIKLTGSVPEGQMDHVNMVRSDNRASNLRLASVTENNRNRTRQVNNTSGYKGVTFHKGAGKYQAKICVNKKRISLGYFADAAAAAQAYQKQLENIMGNSQDSNEPVAYSEGRTLHWHEGKGVNDAQLYLAPPQRLPLTEEEIKAALISVDSETKRLPPGFRDFARAVERAHGIGGEG